MQMSGSVWAGQDTTPAEIEAALRDLLKERHARSEAYVPARVLNLVVVADREWRGEIQNRLDQVGRYHASRTILCCVEEGRETIDAWCHHRGPARQGPGRRQRAARAGAARRRARTTSSTSRPSSTRSWSPTCRRSCGRPTATRRPSTPCSTWLRSCSSTPSTSPIPAGAVQRALHLAEKAYVVDLAWLRSTPWRERVAFAFDPTQWRGELAQDQLGHGQAPARLAGRGPALPRLARHAPGLGAGIDGEPGRRHARDGARPPAGREDAPRARRVDERAGSGRGGHRDGVGRVGLARPRRGRPDARGGACATGASSSGR